MKIQNLTNKHFEDYAEKLNAAVEIFERIDENEIYLMLILEGSDKKVEIQITNRKFNVLTDMKQISKTYFKNVWQSYIDETFKNDKTYITQRCTRNKKSELNL